MTGSRQCRVLLVDDEPAGREHLRNLSRDHAEIEIVGEATSAREIVSMVENLRPDLLFLDVEMPGADVFTTLEDLGRNRTPLTVFVTAYEEYAVRAFEKNAVDYLLKPVHPERFKETLERVFEVMDRQRIEGAESDPGATASGGGERIPVRTRTGTMFVDPGEIGWVEAEGNYVRLHTDSKSYLLRSSMSSIQERLGDGFVRVHRSAIVKLQLVKEFRTGRHDGEIAVVLEDGSLVSVGRKYRSDLEKALGLTV